MNRSRPVCALVAGLLLFLAAARGQPALLPPPATSSVSGQFLVSLAPALNPYFHRLDPGTNGGLLRLEPSLLAVSAERFKSALWREIGLPPDSPWSGKIFLVLHPARSLDEPLTLTVQPFLGRWSYRLELPDLISRERCGRALASVLLLEIANRSASPAHSAAVPAWLPVGLAGLVMTQDEGELFLSRPNKNVAAVAVTRSGPAMMPEGMALTRLNHEQQGLDPLAGARRVLQQSPALTFEQLSWPSEAQLDGADGGVYYASVQLFVHELLAVDYAPAKVRSFLAQLPACENWQAAFFDAFRENYRAPLDVEKWWALRVVAFAARAPGPLWTPAFSRDQLEAALAVPVSLRNGSNALPSYAEITFQSVLRNFAPPRQREILQARLRNLELVQLRLTPELAAIAAGYGQVLAEYLGERKQGFFRRRPGPAATLKQLDALDLRRQEVEANLKLGALLPDLNHNLP